MLAVDLVGTGKLQRISSRIRCRSVTFMNIEAYNLDSLRKLVRSLHFGGNGAEDW